MVSGVERPRAGGAVKGAAVVISQQAAGQSEPGEELEHPLGTLSNGEVSTNKLSIGPENEVDGCFAAVGSQEFIAVRAKPRISESA